MDIYGLIGKKLNHSFSPDYFNKKFEQLGINAEYKIFELDHPDHFPELIADNPKLVGLNVTIPYKRSLYSYINTSDKPAQITGSINTIKIKRKKNNTFLSGYNTDVIGFENSIKPLVKNHKNINALILGTGGSAKSVAYVLRKLGILFIFVSRGLDETLQTNYKYLDEIAIADHLLIVNTTPAGMYPHVNNAPDIPYSFITKKHILFDLIYNPAETVFLKNGKKMGATCSNGLTMLEIQADASWKIWSK